MNRSHNDCILVEKKMNTLCGSVSKILTSRASVSSPVTNSNTSNSSNTSNGSSTTKISTSEKRAPLTKAYSCSDASPLSNDCSFITPGQFVDMISTNCQDTTSLPILDCRSQMDFGFERIRSSHNVNCRTKIVARKLCSKRLEDIEPNLSSSLHNSDSIVLYDQSTDARGEDKIRSLPINLVVQAAKKSNKKVHIIRGGFDAVKTEYPHLIECSSEPPKDFYQQNDVPPSPDAIDKENVVMTKILPHIFVGNLLDAQNPDRLSEHGITHIINCTPDLPLYWENRCKYMRIDILDLPSQNICAHFDAVVQFIDDALRDKGNNVLVHCSAGVSRSPTLVLAYMMKKQRLTLDEAFSKMRQLRPIVDPNVSFVLQLREWEKRLQLSGSTSSSSSSSATVDENNNAGANNRSASSTYCGSSSKSKSDTKARTDSAIVVTF